MLPEEAKLLASLLIPQIEIEHGVTSKVIGAIPVGQADYQPHPKSWRAVDLAWHIVSTECTFLNAVALGKFIEGSGQRSPIVDSPDSVLGWYERRFSDSFDSVRALSPEEFAQPIAFHNTFEKPAVVYLHLLLCHSAHHRGQLHSYLQSMGVEPPRIYGDGPDEPSHPWTPAQRGTQRSRLVL